MREGGSRVPSMVRWPGHVKPGSKSDDIVGGLDLMATFASIAGHELPKNDREGKPIIFDSYDMTPVMTGEGEPERKNWFYFTEDELSPGAIRNGNFKFVFNLRGDDGAQTGGLAVDTNLGWKGASQYVATVPQVFDLLADPQERYDIFMTTFKESTWAAIPVNQMTAELMKTYLEYPPRKLQSETYTGPITISRLPALPVRARRAGEAGLQARAADRQLITRWAMGRARPRARFPQSPGCRRSGERC